MILCIFVFPKESLSKEQSELIPPQNVDYQLVKLVDSCVYAERNHQRWPNHCMKVSLKKNTNYTVLNTKDGVGKLLLLPTENIHGVEDSRLFSTPTPSYFYLAWENRYLISKKIQKNIGKKIHFNSQDYLFSLNAIQSRTQDRLHIHMTCVKKEYQQKLIESNKKHMYSYEWKRLPFDVTNPYTNELMNFISRKVTLNDLKKGRIHKIIKNKVGERYPNFGIALWAISEKEFLLLITDDSKLAAPNRILADSNCSYFLN